MSRFPVTIYKKSLSYAFVNLYKPSYNYAKERLHIQNPQKFYYHFGALKRIISEKLIIQKSTDFGKHFDYNFDYNFKKFSSNFFEEKSPFFIKTSCFLAGDEGIEPSITVLETAVIPFN